MDTEKNHKIWTIKEGDCPLVAAALHDGHKIREELLEILAIDEKERFREEDPFTGLWTDVAETAIVVHHSRFEVDLNRPRDKAIYMKPEDAWGLHLWRRQPDPEMIERSLKAYDAFYREVHKLFSDIQRRFPCFVVYDIHSYNHRRDGSEGSFADPEGNPEVNVGTGTMDWKQWAPVVERFITELKRFDFFGRPLDVRENVRFRGGNFPRWIHENFPDSGCALAIEFKKFFMNEHTGIPDKRQIQGIKAALQSTVSGVLEVLERL